MDLHPLPLFAEPFSAMSHLIAAGLFLVLGWALIARGARVSARAGHRRSTLIYLGVYATACVLLFTASGVYHMVARGGLAERVLLRLDHTAIFILIAGTFTPAHGIVLRGWRRWAPLIVIWAVAAVGIVLRTGLFEGPPPWIGLGLFLAMGWLGLVSGAMVLRHTGWRGVLPLVVGGVLYSAGALMDELRWWWAWPGVIGPHELFHVFVIGGALFHWWFIWGLAGRVWEGPGVGEEGVAEEVAVGPLGAAATR